MALREIEEADLAAMQGIHQVVEKMLKNPEARRRILEARKIIEPNISIPEIDAAKPIAAEMDGVRKSVQELRDELAEERRKAKEDQLIAQFQQKWNDQGAALMARGWRADGVAKVREFAEQNGITDLSIAADAWEVRNPTPDPVRSGFNGWNAPGASGDGEDTFVADMMKSGGKNPRRLDQEIQAAIASVRSGG